MIEKLREFVNYSKTTTKVGSLIINRHLTILAVTEAIPTWLNTTSADLAQQSLTAVFPELNGYHTLLQDVILRNDPRLSLRLSNVSRPQAGQSQNFQLEAQCAPRPGFLLLTMSLLTPHTQPSELEQQVREHTAALTQANVLLEWELEQMRRQQQKTPRPVQTPHRLYPQIGFG